MNIRELLIGSITWPTQVWISTNLWPLRIKLCVVMMATKQNKPRRNLCSGAVPTIFKHKVYDEINMDGTLVVNRPSASHKRTLQLERSQVP